jgi:glycerol-1-phosphate dehydrogenase [NAD(P)+]
MSRPPALTGLESVRTLLATADPEGSLVRCDLHALVIGADVLPRLPEVVADVLAGSTGAESGERNPSGNRAKVVLLLDQTLILRGSDDVKTLTENLLSEHFDVVRSVLNDGHPELHVTDEVVDQAVSAISDADAVVALGGGTISDIGKLAVARPELVGRNGGAPALVSVMTAASVDGYTDNVSVMLRDGVKRTVPSVWPDVVLADADTVAGAPARMTRAGFGEMTSMFVAPADWRLAALAGVDTSFHVGPITLLDALADQLDGCAPGVSVGDPAAVQELTWALALRGIATGVAGTTACLSGVEHLISHMLDLRAAELHLPTGLHGEQVGAGSVVAACAWEMLHERIAAEPGARLRIELLDATVAQDRVRAAFDGLDSTGRIGLECWNDYARKCTRIAGNASAVNDLLAGWPSHVEELKALARPSIVIARGLRAAGATALLSELGDDVDAQTARWAIENCALMRDRFTVVDLLTLLGWWQDDDVDEVLARVEHAVTAQEVLV